MKLITYGCSFTYGQYLDQLENRGTTERPSSHAWPQLTANLLKRYCENYSMPGASNRYIWYQIIQKKFYPTDVVAVHWSFPDRTCVLNSTESTVRHIGVWQNDKVARSWYEHFEHPKTNYSDRNLYVRSADKHIRSYGARIVHMIIPERYSAERDEMDKIVTTEHCDILPLSLLHYHDMPERIRDDKAFDNRHPGKRIHTWLSVQLSRHIRDRLRE